MHRLFNQLSPAVCRRVFRVVAVVEALTWTGLLVGMLFKYALGGAEGGVHLFGPLHGTAFVVYVLSVLVVRTAFGWSYRLTLLALVCSVPPFASLVFELWAERSGRLDVAAAQASRAGALQRRTDQRGEVEAEVGP